MAASGKLSLVEVAKDRHPSIQSIVKFFSYDHLPIKLQDASSPFYDLAWRLIVDLQLDGPELVVALRKLLEAKDAAVRAALDS